MAAQVDLHRTVRERLGSYGQRYTNGRQELVEALLAAEGPMTLPALLKTHAALPQSSAYRNLLVMEQAGVVRRLVHSTGHAHYELAEDLTAHHHHLICQNCGTITDIELAPRLERALDKAFGEITGEAGFTPHRHAIDIYGECKTCAA
jgi:Fur family transcriptional regulator, ferric uptake regulator